MKTKLSKVINTAKSWVSMLYNCKFNRNKSKVSLTYLFMNELAIVSSEDKPNIYAMDMKKKTTL
jgi:hypothetical protein